MDLIQDVRYAARMLRKSPAFALTATLTMALGIGVTTAIFSTCDAMLWSPVPLPHLETLVTVLGRVPDDPDHWNSVSPADLADIQRENTSLQSVASWTSGLANLAGAGGEPERVEQSLVSVNFFDVSGVQPARGHAFQPGDDQRGRDREVILSDRLWRRRFGGDAGIVGQSIKLDDETYSVIGIMPATFDFPIATELWTPLALNPTQLTDRNNQALVAIARLKPGRTIAQAAAETDATAARLQSLYTDSNKNRRFRVGPALEFLVDYETRHYLVMLLGSVVFVLLIACANVANLQFARATGRMREIAVRTALGAGRGRILIQLVTESILLSLMGASLGLLVAHWGMNMIRGGMPAEIERYILGFKDIHLDGRALLFTLIAALLSGVLAGLAPAWQCARPNLNETLREGARGSSAGQSRQRLRNFLVAGEVALAVVLLVGAGLMVRGFRTLLKNGAALQPSTLLTLRLAITDHKYHEKYQVADFYRTVVGRIERLPGVRSAAAVTAMPYSNHASGRIFTIEGRQLERGDRPSAMYQVASAGYFETLHVPLLRGRVFDAGDGAQSQAVAVISERLAQRWWRDENPIGRRIRIGDASSRNPWVSVVGVVGDVVHNTYDRKPRATLYIPAEQAPERFMDIGVRTAADPLLLASAVTAAIRSVDPEQPITEMRTLSKSIYDQSIGLNYMAALMGVFGAIALILSAIGVYGVMAYMVSEQTQEIGVRMALGAHRLSVLQMVMRKGLVVTLTGLLVGLPAAYGFARLMASLVFGVSATDPATFVSIPLALLAAAALAIYLPARRAMNIDPIVALRYE
ncbi:MAG TPA: ABC transporter permease [Bryobacteraceae bacterium]|nr:ABC transporter permease [Bryobacteraceae bacterium]